MEPFPPIWSHLEPIGAIWSHLEPFGSILTIVAHFDRFGAIWGIFEQFGPFGAILTHKKQDFFVAHMNPIWTLCTMAIKCQDLIYVHRLD